MNHDELKRLYLLLEELNDFFHQPRHLDDADRIRSIAERVYPEVRAMYYDIVWKALPEDLQKELEDR